MTYVPAIHDSSLGNVNGSVYVMVRRGSDGKYVKETGENIQEDGSVPLFSTLTTDRTVFAWALNLVADGFHRGLTSFADFPAMWSDAGGSADECVVEYYKRAGLAPATTDVLKQTDRGYFDGTNLYVDRASLVGISEMFQDVLSSTNFVFDETEIAAALVQQLSAAFLAGSLGLTLSEVSNFRYFVAANTSHRSINDLTTPKDVSIGS
jgi:hypothetical protein